MSEKAACKALMESIPEQDPQRIESRGTAPGVPDIWCGDCAIEVKCLRQYPKGESSVVRLDHKLTMHQYRWLSRRWRAGYKAFVVLQARRTEWFLFSALDSFILMDGHEVPLNQMRRHALWWVGRGDMSGTPFDGCRLGDWLKMTRPRIDELRQEMGIAALWKDV